MEMHCSVNPQPKQIYESHYSVVQAASLLNLMCGSRFTVQSNLLVPGNQALSGITEHMSFSCSEDQRCLSDK